jgi:hypothetical protein
MASDAGHVSLRAITLSKTGDAIMTKGNMFCPCVAQSAITRLVSRWLKRTDVFFYAKNLD